MPPLQSKANKQSCAAMVRVNLKDYYPHYNDDLYLDVSDEVAAQFRQWQREEETCQRIRRRYHVGCYGFDASMEAAYRTQCKASSPHDTYEVNLLHEQLCEALSALPPKQSRRIIAHYFIGMSQTAIAQKERVSRNTVSTSIRKGMATLHQVMTRNYY